MKKLAFLFATVVVLVITSCSDYGDGIVVDPKQPTAATDTTKSEPKTDPDTTKTEPVIDDPVIDPVDDEVDWACVVERTFYYDEETGRWPSRLTFHTTGGRDTTFLAYCPMSSTISAPAEVIVDSLAAQTQFVNVDSQVEIDSSNWVQNPLDGYYYRTIKRHYTVRMNNYSATVTSTHVEAKMIRAGKEIIFLFGREQSPYIVDDASTDQGEIGRQGKTYKVELSHLKMSQRLHGLKYETLETYTRVLREKTEIVTPDPAMPNPDLKVSAYGSVKNITFSPEFQGNNVVWHKVCLTQNTINGTEYFSIWVDGSFVRTVELKSNERNEMYNSAYLAEGTWVPAVLRYSSAGDGGWDYTYVLNGRSNTKSIFQQMALTSGLSNFKKDNSAAQTPSVYTTTSVKEYNGKKLVTVNGYDKDNRPVISFTIGECL